MIRRILAAVGVAALTGLAVATLYGIAMYRELQRPASWLYDHSQEGAA